MTFTSLTGTIAVPLTDKDFEGFGAKYTYTICNDEKTLYNELDKRLVALEISLEAKPDELRLIAEQSDQLILLVEEKEAVLLRLDWLNLLYAAAKEAGHVQSKKQAEGLLHSIMPVQNSPMKKQLMSELEEAMKTFSEEAQPVDKGSLESVLTDKAIENGSAQFINLGKTGRDYVISEVVTRYGNKADVAHVDRESAELEHRILQLSKLDDPKKLILDMADLPVAEFHALPEEEKLEFAEKLVQDTSWSGLVSLNQLVKRLVANKNIDKQNEEISDINITTNLGDASTTLNIRTGSNFI